VADVNVLILRAAGTNCDDEAQLAWELAGARVERIHIRRLIEDPPLLDRFQVLTIPGGFSYGDDIAAGRIFAAQIERHLLDRIRVFLDAGKLILGICNGFQILVKAGLLPFSRGGGGWRDCTITYNDPPGFQDRWTYLRAETDRCVFLEKGRTYEFPIAHGEGRVVFARDGVADRVRAGGQIALTFTPPPAGRPAHGEPYNPNGSSLDIAGICDETGRVFGLMPHPERFVRWTQHPCWTSLPERPVGDGLAVFRRAVEYFR
jgi:phosphoribosylformylglycinamidine synthase